MEEAEIKEIVTECSAMKRAPREIAAIKRIVVKRVVGERAAKRAVVE
jgi:hypothetical protein